MSVHKKKQTNRSTAAVWPAIRNIYIYIFECLVLKKQILNCLFPGTLFAAKTDYTVVPKVCMLNVFCDVNILRDCSDTGWAEFNMSVAFYLWSMQLLTFLSNYWISHEKTELTLEIVRFKEFQVVLIVSSFMSNPACFIKGVKK